MVELGSELNHIVSKRQTKTEDTASNDFDNSTFNTLAIWLGALGLLLTYGLIFTNYAPRTLIFIVSACLMCAFLCTGFRQPTSITMRQLLHNFDKNALLLLISVMLLTAQLALSGVFDWAAVFVFSRSEDRVWPLLHRLGVSTFCLAVGLDNVTAIALMFPVTLRCCELARLRARPVLLMVLIISNVASMATMIGNSPNQLIWFDAHKSIMHDISIVKFVAHMLFFVVIVTAGIYVQLRFVHLRNLRLPEAGGDVEMQSEQLLVWQHASERMVQPCTTNDEAVQQYVDQKLAETVNAPLSGNQTDGSFEDRVTRYRQTVSRLCGCCVNLFVQ